MAERKNSDFKFSVNPAAELRRDVVVVVAGDPNPGTALLKAPQHFEVCCRKSAAGALIMKAVAQRYDCRRRVPPQDASETRQGLTCIVGWEELSPPRKRRGFFKMEIGDNQSIGIGPIECARRACHQCMPAYCQALLAATVTV